VYGIVALIVRMDDAGHKLIQRSNDQGILSKLGHVLVGALPVVIRILGVVGTIALLLVAGGIFVHNIHYLHNLFPTLPDTILEFIAGLVVGLVIAGMVELIKEQIHRFSVR
jgi:predicted DNA repair protein MutK